LIKEPAEADLEKLPERLRRMIEDPKWIVNLSTRSRLAQFGLECGIGDKGVLYIFNHSPYKVGIPAGSYPLFRYWSILPWHLPSLRTNRLPINEILISEPKRKDPVLIKEILATPREKVLTSFYKLEEFSPQKFRSNPHSQGQLVLARTARVNVPPDETWILFASIMAHGQNEPAKIEIAHSNSRIVDPGFSGKVILELPFPPYLMIAAPTEIYYYQF
jgi:hypothetical protein